MRKPDFRICENKAADQLRCDCAADQHLSFGYIDSKIPLLPKSESSHHLWLYSEVCVRLGWKPEDRFSHDAAQLFFNLVNHIRKSSFGVSGLVQLRPPKAAKESR